MKNKTFIFIFIFLILAKTLGLYAYTPGPYQILQCPVCENIMKLNTNASGNTYYGRYWTDGYSEFPMLPDLAQSITKCNECGNYLWLEEFIILGYMYTPSQYLYPGYDKNAVYPDSWKRAHNIDFLTLDEYFEAREKGKGDTHENELYIRLQIWWWINHPVRLRGDMLSRLPG